MSFSKLDLATYPFLSSTARIIEELGVSFYLEELLSPTSEVFLRSLERIREAVFYRVTTLRRRDLDVEILSHPVALLIINAMEDKRLLNIYAEAEKNRVHEGLIRESHERVLLLAVDGFGWHIHKEGDGFSLRFDDYLKASTHMLDPYWKLVNRSVRGGYVEVSRKDVCRLLAEAYRARILEKGAKRLLEGLPEDVKPEVEGLRREVDAALPKGKAAGLIERLEYNPSAFPPCISKLLQEAEEGKNLPHMARFTLAAFLLTVGKRPEEVMELFRKMPDFNEEKTAYHLKHVAGEIGSKTRYLPPNCASLRTLNLCPLGDSTCPKVKHPLVYYARMLKLARKRNHE
ncbi:MAG: DNA primase large subunit PriL [Candidatus Nezhaarchaeota archaeon]|nr:DNA primase large subunit PriL [Candidatus Nezhaarchaeota archaeon]